MRRTERPHQVTLRLNDEEIRMRDELALRNGIDAAGVMRQALHRWAREEGISDPEPKPPQSKPARAPR